MKRATKHKVVIGLVMLCLIGFGFFLARMTAKSPSDASVSQIKEVYQCPMHPHIISDKPGLCPICHMQLQRVDSPSSHAHQTMETHSVDGRVGFDIAQDRQQLIGVKVTPVLERPLEITIQTVGQVAYDPELFTAMDEYRQADVTLKQIESGSPEAKERAESVKNAARLRLQLLGLSEPQIRQMLNHSSDTSLVIGRKGAVWVYAQIYESELGKVSPGQTMEISSPAIPGETFKGIIRAIDPVLNPTTRTAKVRAQVSNHKGLLKPQMSLRVLIHTRVDNVLTVPPDAIVNTGKRQIVFVAEGDGHFEPREVKVGIEGDDYVEILSGLKAGEKVVTGANFLMDSESRFRAAVSNLKSVSEQKSDSLAE